MHRFADKVVLITGAGSGIGRATAVRFAAEGARLALGDINEAGLRGTHELLDRPGAHQLRRFDVADEHACRAAVAAAVQQFGRLDVLCNIAGFAQPLHFTEIAAESWQRMLAVNLSGVFYMCQAAMPHLLETRGCIVNMASTAAIVGQAYNSAYCATKGGVLLLSKALAVEFAGRGVRVNAICPGGVNTPLSAAFKLPEGADMNLVGRLWPLIESAEPEEIAAAVAYLASTEARFITGEGLVIDGAQTAS
jgi:meso-butanediol dehydrogenase/(S,S)-butanediol dehydrogenase/diacetyl reductase